MAIALRHRDDPRPAHSHHPGITARPETDAARMAALQGRSGEEMARRMADGHRAWVAYREGEAAGWGWVATRAATIGELGASFRVPEGDRYLWNFVTLPAHRGRGVYPRLVDAIVADESERAERFWIIWAPENHASGRGVAKAGFRAVADLAFDAAGRPAVKVLEPEGGAAATRLLGLPGADEPLSPCWRCARAGRVMHCAPGACRCDYQRAEVACRG